MLRSIRKFLFERNFTEISTPKIIGSATEGGTELFPIIYFDKEAFLTQSAQLYKEQLSGVYERVFEISDCFRAEKRCPNRRGVKSAFQDDSNANHFRDEYVSVG